MKRIKPKSWQYKPSKKVRKHISHWEGSDFEKQNLEFGGDAVAAKGVEFSRMMGDRGKYFTQDELDGMFSTFYNLSPDTFKKVILPQVDKYVGDTSPDNLQAIQDTMRNRWTLAKKVHQNGIRNRANADADLMGSTTKGYTLPDSRTVIFPLLKWEDTKLPEFLPQPIIKPVVSLNTAFAPTPVVTNAPIAADNKQDVWDTFDRGATVYGSRPLLPPLSKLMPSLDEMIADSQTDFVRDTLDIENPFKDVLIHARNGKLPRYEDGTTADPTWHENWLNNRQEQFNENVSLNPRRFKKLGVDTVEGLINNLRNTEETYNTSEFKDKTGNSAPFMYKQYGIGAMTFPKADGSGNIIWYSPIYSGKPYEPLTLEKSYNKDMTLEDIDRWNRKQGYELAPELEVMATRIHEWTHGLSPLDPNNPTNTGLLPQHEKIRRINKEMGIASTKTDGHTSLYDNDAYRNDVEETLAGIMQLRYELGLDPKHHVEMDEIQEWRDKGLLNEYLVGKPNEVLYRYFNDVAYNPNSSENKDGVLYAKNGKLPKLKPRRKK